MAFPSNPSNGDTTTQFGRVYSYNATLDAWLLVSVSANSEVYFTANSAFETANTAGDYANSSFITANAAFEAANNAVDTWVRDAANSASDYANSAFVVANTAADYANSAYSLANTIYVWGDHSAQTYATQSFVNTTISDLVNSAPATLDTLNELAVALNNDPSFATTVSTLIGETRVHSNSAYNQANTGTTLAQSAFDVANNAVDTWVRDAANSASNYANSSFITANAAFEAANNAVDTWVRDAANSASDYANSGFTTANAAQTHAEAAYTAANSSTGVTYTINTSPPASGNTIGDIWIDSNDGILYTWLDDGDSYQWIELGPTPGAISSSGGSGGSDPSVVYTYSILFGA
jgi:hypothetical protein